MQWKSKSFRFLAFLIEKVKTSIQANSLDSVDGSKLTMESKFHKLEEEIKALGNCYKEIHKDIQVLNSKLDKLVDVDRKMMEQRQENGQLKRKIKDWEEVAIEFYCLMERTLGYSDLNEEQRKATERFLSKFEDYVSPVFGLERINPSPGTPFQDRLHQAIGYESISLSDAPPEFVRRCTSWGYRVGSEIIESAQVIVTTLPEIPNEKSFQEKKFAENQEDSMSESQIVPEANYESETRNDNLTPQISSIEASTHAHSLSPVEEETPSQTEITSIQSENPISVQQDKTTDL